MTIARIVAITVLLQTSLGQGTCLLLFQVRLYVASLYRKGVVSFPNPPPPFRRFYLDRGAEEGSGNIAIPFLYRGGGVTDE